MNKEKLVESFLRMYEDGFKISRINVFMDKEMSKAFYEAGTNSMKVALQFLEKIANNEVK